MIMNSKKTILCVIAVMISLFFCGCEKDENQVADTPVSIVTEAEAPAPVEQDINEEQPKEEKTEVIIPQEEDSQKISVLTCTLSISCDEAAEKYKDKVQSGKVYFGEKLVFNEGETAFDVLVRETEKNNIPLEYEKNNIYNSVYIKGINNLYEKDCGSFSGWIYKINGSSPNKGCSEYILKDGDKIEFIYTCG